jgi:hypothetical protein
MQKADLEQMKLMELRNLLLGEMSDFIAALDHETSLQLEERKRRMHLIEEVMDKKSGRYPQKMVVKRS